MRSGLRGAAGRGVRRRAITGTPAAAAAARPDLQAAAAFWCRDLSRRGSLGRRQPVLYLSTHADKPPAAVPDQPSGLRQRGPLLDSHHVDGPDVWFPGQQIGRHFGWRRRYLAADLCGARVVDTEGVAGAIAAITDLERVPGDGAFPGDGQVPAGSRNASSSPPLPGLASSIATMPSATVISMCPFSESKSRAVQPVSIYWRRQPPGFLPVPRRLAPGIWRLAEQRYSGHRRIPGQVRSVRGLRRGAGRGARRTGWPAPVRFGTRGARRQLFLLPYVRRGCPRTPTKGEQQRRRRPPAIPASPEKGSR